MTEGIETLTTDNCNHKFHKKCLKTWSEKNIFKEECPNCRGKLTDAVLQQLNPWKEVFEMKVCNGELINNDGSHYKGQLNEFGEMHGRGVLTLANGDVFEG